MKNRKSPRLRQWNYAWNAAYFITILTKNRVHHFGEIEEGVMRLSEIGKIVEEEWLRGPILRPEMNLHLGAYVIMPDHFHAILEIGRNPYNTRPSSYAMSSVDHRRDALHASPSSPAEKYASADSADALQRVPTAMDDKSSVNCGKDASYASLPSNRFGPQSNNLAAIIRGFKGAVTRRARTVNPNFVWQSRYHDRLIRTQASYGSIHQYIQQNPQFWAQD